MSLRNKTNLAFLVALIALAIIGWFSLQRNQNTAEIDHLVSHSRDVLEATESLRSHVSDAAAARRAFTLWGDPTQSDAFNVAYNSALADFESLRKLTEDSSEQRARVAQIEPLMVARLSLLKESVELHQKSRDDAKEQATLTDRNARASAQFTEQIKAFDAAERTFLQQQIAAAQVSNQQKTRINAFLGVFVFLFLMLTLGVLNRELWRREKAEGAAAEQKELLQSILDSCNDAVIVADPGGKILLRNPVGIR